MDVIFGCVYTIRVTYFFLWYAEDSYETRLAYYDKQKLTAYLLAFGAASVLVLKYVEWGHTPVFETTGWVLCGLLNFRNYTMLKAFKDELEAYHYLRSSNEKIELIREKAY